MVCIRASALCSRICLPAGERAGENDFHTGATNTNTLIQVLSSPLLLEPVEERLGIPAGELESVLSVSTAQGARRGAGIGNEGVLEVRLQWPDPVQGEAILREVSRAYLQYSLRQRQEKLTQGLSFLDQQAPELQQRVNQLQSQLSEFRQRNSFVERASRPRRSSRGGKSCGPAARSWSRSGLSWRARRRPYAAGG
jgi:hypothetical protein